MHIHHQSSIVGNDEIIRYICICVCLYVSACFDVIIGQNAKSELLRLDLGFAKTLEINEIYNAERDIDRYIVTLSRDNGNGITIHLSSIYYYINYAQN